jgi:3-phenylpropionate/trans-cinnamate dioxygenase ferredoxin subunit
VGYIDVAQTDQIPSGTMKAFRVEDKDLVIVNSDGNYYALAGKCPHMGGDLSRGVLEAAVITCPVHGAKFNVTTGANVEGPKMGFLKLKTKDLVIYPVLVEGSTIKVNIG